MRDISTKFTGDSYSAAEFNSSQVELENIVTSAGLTLDPAGGPDNNQIQLGQAAAAYACGGDVFGATGTVNDIVLAHTSLLKDPVAYVDKMRVTFKAAGANTGAVTVNVDSIGVKKVLYPGGGDLTAGQIVAGAYTTLIYDTSLESGSGAFELMLYPTSTINVIHRGDHDAQSGGPTSGAWYARPLNALRTNDIGSAVALSGGPPTNTMSLPAGSYDFFLSFNAFTIGFAAVRIRDTTAGATVWPSAVDGRGTVNFDTGGDLDHHYNVNGRFVLAAAGTIQVQIYCTNSNTTDGNGERIIGTPELNLVNAENIWLDLTLIKRNYR